MHTFKLSSTAEKIGDCVCVRIYLVHGDGNLFLISSENIVCMHHFGEMDPVLQNIFKGGELSELLSV